MNNTWDKRSWLLALGGNLCGLICAVCNYPPSMHAINRLWPFYYGGWRFADSMGVLVGTVGLFALPMYLSATVPHRSFLYALLPPAFISLWLLAETVIEYGPDTFLRDAFSIMFSTAMGLLGLLLTCGPISLYRWTQRRKRERLFALQQAMQDAADAPQEGVWPPPPRRP